MIDHFGYKDKNELIGKIENIIQPDKLKNKLLKHGEKRERSVKQPNRYVALGLTKDGINITLEVHAKTVSFEKENFTLAFMIDLSGNLESNRALGLSEGNLHHLNCTDKILNAKIIF